MTDLAPPIDAAGLAELRKPFPPASIGKLPRITCKPCSKRTCSDHHFAKCPVCKAYTSPAHIHLDYVGHAEVTDRLLSVDPAWSWEPVAIAAAGTPVITDDGGERSLWIRLTVCGVTRLGVGTVAADKDDVAKQLVSDALRNAAMRFGVALDLWAKSDLAAAGPAAPADDDIDPATGSVRTTATRPVAPVATQGNLGTPVGRPAPATRTSRARAALAAGAPAQAPADPADPFRPFDEASPPVLAGETWVRTFAITVREAGHSDAVRHAIVDHATGGRTRSTRQVHRNETAKVRAAYDALRLGELVPANVAGVVVLVAATAKAGAA